MVSENSQASVLWAWLKESGPAGLPAMHVVNITWFTDSMREGRPVAVETRHLIQVGAFQKLGAFNNSKWDVLVDATLLYAETTAHRIRFVLLYTRDQVWTAVICTCTRC